MIDYSKLSREFREYHAACTDKELLRCYNMEITKQGWGASRSYYLSSLRHEMYKRGWDISVICNDTGGFNLHPSNNCKLEGKRLVKTNLIYTYKDFENNPEL